MDAWTVVGALVAAAVAFKWWYRATSGVCTSARRLDGLTALVTGANTGIGLETARDLARRGARVLLACRDPQRGKCAVEAVRAVASKGATVELLSLDLASLASVRACAAKVVATEERLDILVNNAGAGGLGPGMTSDGLHRGLQVNHFGPFLFTLLLLDLMKKSAPSRVIFVSSLMHRFAVLKPHLLDHARAKDIGDRQIYSITKLANVIIANELARKLRGTGVTANSLHPGLVRTEFFRRLPWFMDAAVNAVAGLFCKNAVEGAQTTIYLAVSEDMQGVTGRYFADCKRSASRPVTLLWLGGGGSQRARMSSQALDEALARAVWEKSEQLVQLTDQERPLFSS